jgi:hypothetical protein
MATLVALQGLAGWFVGAGFVLLIAALVAHYLVKRIPDRASTVLIWVGAALIALGLIVVAGPSIVGIFFARPV